MIILKLQKAVIIALSFGKNAKRLTKKKWNSSSTKSPATFQKKDFISGISLLVVQWTERGFPEPKMRVRFLPRGNFYCKKILFVLI